MSMFRCMTVLKMRDWLVNELEETKMVNVKNSKRVIKYSRKGGMAAGSITILLNPSFSHP